MATLLPAGQVATSAARLATTRRSPLGQESAVARARQLRGRQPRRRQLAGGAARLPARQMTTFASDKRRPLHPPAPAPAHTIQQRLHRQRQVLRMLSSRRLLQAKQQRKRRIAERRSLTMSPMSPLVSCLPTALLQQQRLVAWPHAFDEVLESVTWPLNPSRNIA